MANNIDSAELTALLGASLGGAAYTAVSPQYLALDTTAPTNAATMGTEVTGGSYARKQISFGTATYSAGTASIATAGTYASQTFTGMPNCTVNSVEIFTASTGTTRRLWWGNLAAPKTVAAGDTLSFAAGAITATLT